MKIKVLFILLLTCQMGYGQYYGKPNPLAFNSSGNAILRIEPNQIVLSLGVESRGQELIPTKKKNYAVMTKAIAYCRKLGIPEKYIQTDFISISPVYERYDDIKIKYYAVSQSISIILEDLPKYEELLTQLLEFGINKVNNIEFRTTELKKYRYKVRKMAIDAAKEKATFLAEEVGIKLGRITNIGEIADSPVNSFNRNNYANIAQNVAQNVASGLESGTLSIGMISLKSTVHLTYKIEE